MWNTDECLEAIRMYVMKIEDGDYPVSDEDLWNLVKQIRALDAELTAGGNLPRSWKR